MKPQRASNVARRQWRDRCRKALADHIKKNTGVSIDPSEVRLMPSATDPYAWECLPEAAALFKKHLSGHSIRAYQKLCQYVGKQFEAVKSDPEGSHWESEGGQTTFTSRIRTQTLLITQLEEELRMNVKHLSVEKIDHQKCQSELDSVREKYESQQDAINALTLKSQALEELNKQLAQGVLSMAQTFEKLRATADRELESASTA